ncbi:hypothetical protein FUA23_07110 [Neolewinella aurantiaca]|uniref:Uncharacterized protein n=1 Tax=Neolewinella aurantiaca TaxID=2602767 RepID=A0A5C7FK83_9BACT|nr:hypothetical protein [Neolewinella aurantiaca]TXF90281.1 hypothetical protein FUA23_07110 [Neolewinella aurantiaca]
MNRFIITLLLCVWAQAAFAIVKYDEGRRTIDGIILLQDSDVPTDYYYFADAPRLAVREDGTFELMCIKYIGGPDPADNGGLLHALVEFSLTPERIREIEAELRKEVPNGRIAGPVPLHENIRDGEEGMGSMEVVSSVLSDTEGEKPLTQSIVSSNHCPLLPGSRAAIAAKLSQEGATLLWSSFEGATSDVSVSISGYYEAYVKGYNAVIEAEASTVYEHFSLVFNEQGGYDRSSLREAVNELIQDQKIKVEVFDRSEGLGIDTKDMAAIVDLVTNKLIELMFDAKLGWAARPETIPTLDQGQIKGRQERGGFSRFFAGTGDQKYVTDNQFVLKDEKYIRTSKFYLNLSKATSIKVPFFTTGNIRGMYDLFNEDGPYFRVVNLEEADFANREVIFQIDGSFAEAFSSILNFVTVSFRKRYGNGQEPVTKEIVITGKDLKTGTDFKSIVYPALGLSGRDLLNYNYRLSWSFKGESQTVNLPHNPDDWLDGALGAVSLKPPFAKSLVEVDADLESFGAKGMQAATVVFFTVLNGSPQIQQRLTLRANDTENTHKIALYHDHEQTTAYQIRWIAADGSGSEATPIRELTDGYLFLTPKGG